MNHIWSGWKKDGEKLTKVVPAHCPVLEMWGNNWQSFCFRGVKGVRV